MASPVAASSSQIVALPHIRELYDPNFLDLLVPVKQGATRIEKPQPVQVGPTNPMMEALKSTAHQTFTENLAPTYSSTSSATLDAFQTLKSKSHGIGMIGDEFTKCLNDSWAEDPQLTLRIIWNIRSIHDGRGDKEMFYRAFGWLYEHHPRTAISNLHMLVDPVCPILHKDKQGRGLAHGYWKDLLNILALATVDQLCHSNPRFLHTYKERQSEPHRRYGPLFVFPQRKKTRIEGEKQSPEAAVAHIEASLQRGTADKLEAQAKRAREGPERYEKLVKKLEEQPKYRALYIAVARLFADGLARDLRIAEQLEAIPVSKTGPEPADVMQRRRRLLRQLSLVGKWAPTPQGAHDRHTNISTAIGMLLRDFGTPSIFPSALNDASLEPAEAARILRSFYQRWVLTPLRSLSCVPEPLMSARRWTEIKYGRVSSVCMQNNTDAFYKHDPDGFQSYLISVESGQRTISGATLFPHELVGEALRLAVDAAPVVDPAKVKYPALKDARRSAAETKMRVVEQQWKTLIARLKESGKMENALAICDVSGSMGSLHEYRFGDGRRSSRNREMRADPSPILPAISLSLVLAHLAKPPFNGGFITFSANPHFVSVDLTRPLAETVKGMAGADWTMNTDFNAVFVKLLLPLAVKNKVRPEDMIKRLFVFSDMQFDDAAAGRGGNPANWETNHGVVERAYREAGYEVPQIVYWDLGGYGTVEVQAERKGVALMNGFSPAMLKVFMGESEEGWEDVGKDGETKTVEEEFNPVNVMRKALMKRSFDGLVVVD